MKTPSTAQSFCNRIGLLSLLLFFSACQARQTQEQSAPGAVATEPADTGSLTPILAPTSRMPLPGRPVKRPVKNQVTKRNSGTARREQPTLFPDTLRPRPLEVHYWSDAQVDSMAGDRGACREEPFCTLSIRDKYDPYTQYDRYFCRQSDRPHGWTEVVFRGVGGENLKTEAVSFTSVDLDRQGPKEILARVSVGWTGSGGEGTYTHSLILTLTGVPQVLWHSVDGITTRGHSAGSGSYGIRSMGRRMAVRQGQVQVSKAWNTEEFGGEGMKTTRSTVYGIGFGEMTPIAPGQYHYQNGRFIQVGKAAVPRQ